MLFQNHSKNRRWNIKTVVFMSIISLAGLGLAAGALAGEGGMTLKFHAQTLQAGGASKSGPCPQPRKTQSAPASLAKTSIPATADGEAGKKIFQKSAKPMACKMCHGPTGEGNGKLGRVLNPRPRNFNCADTMKHVSPGQMFWIIKNGSKGTGMVAHGKTLNDKQIWDVVKYIDTKFVKR
jgi:mono/diheme cytochrome c family protein